VNPGDNDTRARNRNCLLLAIGLGLLCAAATCCIGLALWGQAAGFFDREIALPPLERTPGAPASASTLRLPGDLPPTLDPAMVQDATSAEYVVHLFAGLVRLNAELEVTPDLAERWDTLEDGRVYLFHLREDAVFADGSPITADDFIYSLERACSPELGSPVALAYLGDIVGAEAFAQGLADQIAGLEAVGPQTLRIEIDSPKAYFMAKLTYPTALVVDRRQIEREGERWILQPNGSGPFVLEELGRERIILRRNERYHGGPPALERVILELSGGLPITMYENDQLDIVWAPADELDRVLDPHHPLSQDVRVVSELSTEYLAMNVNQPPYDDPAVRQAILHAIDRDKLAELVLNNSADAARGIVPPALIPEGDDPAQAAIAYDPALARELLAGSRYGQEGAMPPLVLNISGYSGYMGPVPQAVLAMLEENLGLEFTVEQAEWSDFLQDLNRGRYGMYISGWIADYPDPQNFLDLLFHSASAQNHLGYANPQVDALLEQARTEPDDGRRAALYQESELLILADAPWVPLTHGVSYILAKPWVQGYRAGGSLYPWLKNIWLQAH
jgi:ABC-type transport system substrate-binding protein